jgi:hypothetical protein
MLILECSQGCYGRKKDGSIDHSTVIFQKEKEGGRGYVHIKKSLVCKTPIVEVDRNKNVTLKGYSNASVLLPSVTSL